MGPLQASLVGIVLVFHDLSRVVGIHPPPQLQKIAEVFQGFGFFGVVAFPPLTQLIDNVKTGLVYGEEHSILFVGTLVYWEFLCLTFVGRDGRLESGPVSPCCWAGGEEIGFR